MIHVYALWIIYMLQDSFTCAMWLNKMSQTTCYIVLVCCSVLQCAYILSPSVNTLTPNPNRVSSSLRLFCHVVYVSFAMLSTSLLPCCLRLFLLVSLLLPQIPIKYIVFYVSFAMLYSFLFFMVCLELSTSLLPCCLRLFFIVFF